MKFKLVVLFLFVYAICGYSQDIQLLANFNNKSFGITNIIEKDINSKWDYFSLSEVGSAYNDKSNMQFESNQFFNYSLKNNFALTTGFGLQNDNVLPQIGISYENEHNNWTYAFYPTLNYGISDKQFGALLNSILEFSPSINGNWDFYSLALLDFDCDFGKNLFSQQSINIGLQYKEKFQFGVNIDFEQEDNFNDTGVESGVFLGVSF